MHRYLLLIGLVCLLSSKSIAQTTGNGCLIGTAVYTTFMGTDTPYGAAMGQFKIYQSNGAGVYVNTVGNSGTRENYVCGQINEYYVYPSNFHRHELIELSYDCAIEATLGGTPIARGTYVSYSYNDPTLCNGNMPAPLENYQWLFVALTAGTTIYFLRNRLSTEIES
ncbi:MAG: hypothetical protein JKY70_22480 [Mucilaginibacter sp.]|nr:hypothetical protein [Mucilaginibacter sp.]